MCECESCKMGRKVADLRAYMTQGGVVSNMYVKTLDELYSAYVHEGIDHDHLKAIVDNNWPSAEAYMKSKGWVREQKK